MVNIPKLLSNILTKMYIDGFILQILSGSLITIQLAVCAATLGIIMGLMAAMLESIPWAWLRFFAGGIIFIIRGLPELLVLFFIYFGVATLLSQMLNRYVDISAFSAGVVALGLIFAAYASQVFRGAFLAIDQGQIEAAQVLGLSRWQVFTRIEIPQAWRHAIPGLGNLWMSLLKDTAIVSLIGLGDMMNQAKMAATTTHQPFTFYFIAAAMYLLLTSISQYVITFFTRRANRYLHA